MGTPEHPATESGGEPLAWQLLDSTVAYRAFLTLESRRYRMPDGRITRWDILAGAPCVCVLAVTLAGTVVVARQFRPGPGLVFDELPGGIVDPGEDPAVAAARELREETGYAAAEVELVGGTWLAGFSGIYRHFAVATGCQRVGEPIGGHDESCTPRELTRAQFLDLLRSGNLGDSDCGYRAADRLGWLSASQPGLSRADRSS